MKTNKITISDIKKIHSHPASILFRSIELKSIHQLCKNYEFNKPNSFKSIDIGCADGKISKLIFDSNFTYGVDNGEVADYRLAIENKIFDKLFVESAEKMSLKSNSVDFAFSNSVLEHIKNVDSVLLETNRILKSGGYFVFTVPSIYFKKYLETDFNFTTGICILDKVLNRFNIIKYLSKKYSTSLQKKLNHYHLYNHKSWGNKFNKVGFEVIDYGYYIDKKSLLLWNTLLILGKIFNHNNLYSIFSSCILKTFNNSILSKKSGAALVFICKK